MMRHARTRAQILVLFALAALVLLGFVALGVDSSRVYMDRRRAQNAADAAALSMAWEWIRTQGDCTAAEAKGQQVAADMGYTNTATTTVETYCPPADGQYQGQNGHMQVRITTTTETTFLRVLGLGRLTSTVESVARASLGTLFGSNAVVAMSESGQGGLQGGIKLEGNAHVFIRNGGMFSNSNDGDKSLWALNNSEIGLTTGQTLNTVGGCTVPPAYQSLCRPGTAQVNYAQWLADLDKIIPPIPTPPACTTTVDNLSENGGTLGQSGQTVVYCVNGDVSLSDVTLRGKVVLRVQGTVDLDGQIDAENLEIYLKDEDLTFGASTEFTAQRLRIYGLGRANVNVLGGAQVTSDDALIYLTDGLLDQRGNTGLKLCPPPQDDQQGFGGLAVFLKNTTATLIINGNTENWIAGTVLAPHAPVQFNGNTSNQHVDVRCHGITAQGIPSQIIGKSVKFNGNSWSYVDFIPNLLFRRPTISLLK